MATVAALRKYAQHPLMLTLYVPSLLYAFAQSLLLPVLPLYAAGFGVSYVWIGLLLAGEGIGTLLGDIPAGILLRRQNTRRVMLLGLLGVAASTLGLFFAGSFGLALLLRLIGGFSNAFYGVSRHTFLTGAVGTTRRGRAIAIFGGVFRVGRFTGPALGGLVAGAFGLRAPFLLHGLATMAAFSCVVLFMQVEKAKRKNEALLEDNPPAFNLLATLRLHFRPLAIGGVGQMFAQMIRAGWAAVIPLYGSDVLGLPEAEIGLILSLLSLIDVSLFFIAGLVMDRWGRKYAIVPSFALQAVGLALVPFALNFAGLLLASLLIGLGNGLGSGTMMTLGADLAPAESRGEFLGIWRLIGDVGVTGGPLVVGMVADIVALPVAGWAISGAGVAAALIFALLVPETLKRKT